MIGQYGFIDSNTNQNGGKYIIPLNFWFCEDNSLAFPLVALQFHSIKLMISCNEFSVIGPIIFFIITLLYIKNDSGTP